MLHARKDYDRIQDPWGDIPQYEPVFLLRGQDKFAPELLLRWAAKLRLDGGDVEMAQMVEGHAQEMLNWQETYGKKRPDLPKKRLLEEDDLPF